MNLLNLFKEFKLSAAYAPDLVDAFYPYDEVSAVHDFKYLANGLSSQDLNGWDAQEVDIVVFPYHSHLIGTLSLGVVHTPRDQVN